jgi:hypothetical protein
VEDVARAAATASAMSSSLLRKPNTRFNMDGVLALTLTTGLRDRLSSR